MEGMFDVGERTVSETTGVTGHYLNTHKNPTWSGWSSRMAVPTPKGVVSYAEPRGEETKLCGWGGRWGQKVRELICHVSPHFGITVPSGAQLSTRTDTVP